MTAAKPPTALDLRACAQKAETLSGQAPLAAFARLIEDLPELDQLAPVRWSAQAEFRQPLGELTPEVDRGVAPEAQLWLHLQASAEVPQTCQRCLSPYAQPVEVDRWFRFVASEEVALAEDDASEEDLLVFEPRLDLVALLEDELLMELPLANQEAPVSSRHFAPWTTASAGERLTVRTPMAMTVRVAARLVTVPATLETRQL